MKITFGQVVGLLFIAATLYFGVQMAIDEARIQRAKKLMEPTAALLESMERCKGLEPGTFCVM